LVNSSKWTQNITQLLEDAEILHKSAGDILDKYDKEEVANSVKQPLANLKKMRGALLTVFARVSDKMNEAALQEALEAYIEEIKAKTKKPPIQKYLDLSLAITLCIDGETQLLKCETAAEAKACFVKLKCHQLALSDLVTSTKAASQDVERALVGSSKLSKLQSALTHGKLAAHNATVAGSGTGSAFELVQAAAKPIPMYNDPLTPHDHSNIDNCVPYIVKQVVAFKSLKCKDPLSVELEAFSDKFQKWENVQPSAALAAR
jgi:hypothetical protein